MQKIPIFNYDDDVINLIGKINLFKATNSDCKENDLIIFSGLEAIQTLLLKTLEEFSIKNKLKSYFIEYTSIATLLDEKVSVESTLADFILVSNNNNGIIKKDKVECNYYALYTELKENGYGLFYNKEFFRETTRIPVALLSDNIGSHYCLSSVQSELIRAIKNSSVKAKKLNIFSNGCANGCLENIRYRKLDNLIKFREYSLEDLNQLLHELYVALFCDNDINHKTYLLSIPTSAGSVNGDTSSSKYNGLGAIFLLLDFENTSSKVSDNFFKKLIYNLSFIIKDITYNYVFEAGIIQYENAYRGAVKSGMAAIMSRNGSHNIGSHVLAKVSSNFNEVPDSQTLFKYIQQRMDFIAQITTEFPQWSYPAWFIRDLMRRFYMQRTLLNYIAESESLNAYEFQGNNEGKGNLLIKILDKDFEEIISDQCDEAGKEIKNDFQIAIPGGVVGVHAFYTILENIIRNSAKHAWKKEANKKFELYIRFVNDNFKDHVKFQIFDNCTENNTVDKKPLVERMNKIIKDSFIDDFGVLKKENWGVAEIKISLGYLKKEKLEFIGENSESLLYDPHNNGGLVRFCEIKNTKTNKIHYGYEFSIPKPKEVLIITEDDSYLSKKSAAKNYNIDIENSLPDDLDYEFVIINEKTYASIKNGQLSLENFPFRLFLFNNQINDEHKSRVLPIDNLDLSDYNKFKLLLYKQWIDDYLLKGNSEKKHLYIKSTDDSPNDSSFINSDLAILPRLINKNKQFLIKKIGLSEDEFNSVLNKTNELIKNYSINNWELRLDNVLDEIKLFGGEKDENLGTCLETLLAGFTNFSNKYEEDIETLPKVFRANGSEGDTNYPKFIQEPENLILPNQFSIEKSDFLGKVDTESKKNTYIFTRHCTIGEGNIYNYVEALSGSQFYFSLLESEQSDFSNKLLLQLIESATLNVLIIDERVSEYFYSVEDEIKRRYVAAKIIIPQKIKHYENGQEKVELLVQESIFNGGCQIIADFTNLNKVSVGYSENNNMWEKKIGKISSDKFNILIIHQGVLDKLYHKKSVIEEKIKLLKKSLPFIVITSGRGTPSELPDNEKFLPFSDLKEFIMKPYHEKLIFINTIMKTIAGRKNL